MNFEAWDRIEFPVPVSQRTGEVYVLFYSFNQDETPFYVGQTVRFMERMGDYEGAQFAASTDFKVGHAIKFLTGLGHKVFARHKTSIERRFEEREVIEELETAGFKLFNSLEGYNYSKAEVTSELEKVHDFCRRHYQLPISVPD